MRLKTITKGIKLFLKKLLKFSTERIFLTFWGLLILILIIAGLIFYQYSFLIQKMEPQIFEKPFQFQEKTFQEILIIWQEREKRFEQTNLKEYPDFFSEKRKQALKLNQEKTEEEIIPELPLELPDDPKLEALQAAITLSEFYFIKGETLPSIKERAKIWQEKNFGRDEEYIGASYQNKKLLNELKKELTL